MEKFTTVRTIGQRTTGDCVLALNNQDGLYYVMKHTSLDCWGCTQRQDSLRAAHVISSLRHPNIIRYVDSFLVRRSNQLCIIMEYADGGNLGQRLFCPDTDDTHTAAALSPPPLLREEQIVDWLIQLALGLYHLHKRHILHRNLTPQNVFVTSDNILKLGGFVITPPRSGGALDHAAILADVPCCLSPELLQDKPHNAQSDAWALGVLLYAMMTRRHPFCASREHTAMQCIRNAEYEPPPPAAIYSPPLRSLLLRLLVRDPARRIAMEELLKQPILHERMRVWLRGDVVPKHYLSVLIRDALLPQSILHLYSLSPYTGQEDAMLDNNSSSPSRSCLDEAEEQQPATTTTTTTTPTPRDSARGQALEKEEQEHSICRNRNDALDNADTKDVCDTCGDVDEMGKAMAAAEGDASPPTTVSASGVASLTGGGLLSLPDLPTFRADKDRGTVCAAKPRDTDGGDGGGAARRDTAHRPAQAFATMRLLSAHTSSTMNGLMDGEEMETDRTEVRDTLLDQCNNAATVWRVHVSENDNTPSDEEQADATAWPRRTSRTTMHAASPSSSSLSFLSRRAENTATHRPSCTLPLSATAPTAEHTAVLYAPTPNTDSNRVRDRADGVRSTPDAGGGGPGKRHNSQSPEPRRRTLQTTGIALVSRSAQRVTLPVITAPHQRVDTALHASMVHAGASRAASCQPPAQSHPSRSSMPKSRSSRQNRWASHLSGGGVRRRRTHGSWTAGASVKGRRSRGRRVTDHSTGMQADADAEAAGPIPSEVHNDATARRSSSRDRRVRRGRTGTSKHVDRASTHTRRIAAGKLPDVFLRLTAGRTKKALSTSDLSGVPTLPSSARSPLRRVPHGLRRSLAPLQARQHMQTIPFSLPPTHPNRGAMGSEPAAMPPLTALRAGRMSEFKHTHHAERNIEADNRYSVRQHLFPLWKEGHVALRTTPCDRRFR